MIVGTHIISSETRNDCSHWPSCCPSKEQDSTQELLTWSPASTSPPEALSLTYHPESCKASRDGPLNRRAISPWSYEWVCYFLNVSSRGCMRDPKSSTQFDLPASFNWTDQKSLGVTQAWIWASTLSSLHYVGWCFSSSGWLPSFLSLDYILEANI